LRSAVEQMRLVVSFDWQRKDGSGCGLRADRKTSHYPMRDMYLSIKSCVPKLAVVVALVALTHSALADSNPADDDFDSAIKALCKSKDTEGSYDWKLDGASARLWVICQSETRLLASISIPDSFYAVTMVHTAINRRNPDILSFATYDLSAEGAKTVNGRIKSHAVLRLSIQALRHGMAVGEFQRNPILPISVNAARTKPLPSLLAEAGPAQESSFPFSGNFYIEEPKDEWRKREFELVKIKPPACLVTAIDGNLRTVNFHDSGNLAIWLAWGSSVDSGGNVFYSTSGVDDGLAGKDSVTQIRGVFLTSNLIEFFYFNSLTGLSGPFHAARMDDQVLACNPCRPHVLAGRAAGTGECTRESPFKRTTSTGRAAGR
jgi:hypothetical protein